MPEPSRPTGDPELEQLVEHAVAAVQRASGGTLSPGAVATMKQHLGAAFELGKGREAYWRRKYLESEEGERERQRRSSQRALAAQRRPAVESKPPSPPDDPDATRKFKTRP